MKIIDIVLIVFQMMAICGLSFSYGFSIRSELPKWLRPSMLVVFAFNLVNIIFRLWRVM